MSDNMTWEDTIKYIRTKPEYRYLIEKAYFEEDLSLNVERFRASEEYIETRDLLNKFAPKANNILDVGSGNGISAIAFALDGYNVTATEPDLSDTIGAGAIRFLKEHYRLENLTIYTEYAENIQYHELFDIIYVRQAMHHAYDLNKFIKNLSSLLKPNGILLTTRDHVIYDDVDKAWFLASHPLHRYYGGENAFQKEQYLTAFQNADLELISLFKYYDSVINYFPLTKEEYEKNPIKELEKIKRKLQNKLGFIGKLRFVEWLYKYKIGFSVTNFYNEKKVPGRIYSFLLKKK